MKSFWEIPGVHFDETWAPTCRIKSLRQAFEWAVRNGCNFCKIDVKTAFLNAPITVPIYVSWQDSFGRTHYARLKKSLYGLKQAPRDWHEQVSKRIDEMGFEKSIVDSCLSTKKVDEKIILVLLVHVDDFIIFYKDTKWKDFVINNFSKTWTIKEVKDEN